jgi:cysteinyl-tRNA synthetase
MSELKKAPLYLTNTLTRKKEEFKPLAPPHVGLYACGPTVYQDVHLGNVRSFMTFDVLRRWLTHPWIQGALRPQHHRCRPPGG